MDLRLTLPTILIAALLGACASGPQQAATGGVETLAEVAAVAPQAAPHLDTAKALSEAAALIPADAVMVAVVDARYFLETIFVQGMGLMPETLDSAAMLSDLGKLSVERFGVDFTKTSWFIFAVTEEEIPLFILNGRFGTPVGFSALEQGVEGRVIQGLGGTLISTGHPNFLMMLESRGGIEEMAKVLSKQKPSLATDGLLVSALKEAGPGIITVAAAIGQGPMSQGLKSEMTMGMPPGLPIPDAAAASVSEKISVVLMGRESTLKGIEGAVNMVFGMAKGSIDEEMKRLDEKDPIEAAATVAASHWVNALTQSLAPTIEGEVMRFEYEAANARGAAASLPIFGLLLPIMAGAGFVF